jgi:hypothetical protein
MAGTGVDLRERFLGCVLGCAVGDALGAPYEGLWAHSIPDEATLLADYGEFEGYPKGQYTDDTQPRLPGAPSRSRPGSGTSFDSFHPGCNRSQPSP